MKDQTLFVDFNLDINQKYKFDVEKTFNKDE
jgi:hypothetical protein